MDCNKAVATMNARLGRFQTNGKALTLLAVTCLAMIGAMGTLEAHRGATGIVKQRMMAMKSMGEGMKALAAMVKGRAPYDPAKTAGIAAALRDHARKIPEQFPKGSIQGPSEALPGIWKDWKTFKGQADQLAVAADELSKVAADGKDAMLALFPKIGGTCSACHKSFREKKK
jgi:cytochrome c556